ncbi:MAG: MOSC domain-containing protein [Actinomycetes bacterium]|jgi:MOSC domain-containing protein YiiM
MGRVHQINVSPGGVPKLPVPGAVVTALGIVGDDHHDRKHHGGPERALCLYSLEVIEEMRAEGHDMAPGHAGENLTIAGVDWSTVVPGNRYRIGHEVEIEITSYTTPCATNARWFVDGKFGRMSQQRHPGESRVYARVLREGTIRTGAAFEPL